MCEISYAERMSGSLTPGEAKQLTAFYPSRSAYESLFGCKGAPIR